jgi:hypothetical protein
MAEILLGHARGTDSRMAVRAAQLIIERAHGAPPTREESRFVLGGDTAEDTIEIVLVKPIPTPDDPDYVRVVH